MEDRYLFKAKRIDNREWVEGYYAVIGEKVVIIEKRGEEFYDVEGEKKSHGNKIIEVDPSTICQCTTFKDRNGNLVWENDLLKKFTGEGDDWEIAKVILGEYCLSLGWCQAGVKSLNRYNTDLFECALSRYDASKCEIVGNIFDNPELLESEG